LRNHESFRHFVALAWGFGIIRRQCTGWVRRNLTATTTAALSANPTPTSVKATAAWPLGNAAETAADGRECRRKSSALKLGPNQLREHTLTEKHAGLEATTRLTLRRASNLSRGHQNTQNTLKRKKQARLDGQRIGKIKVATIWSK
jgi:hypothetical protein